MTPAERSSSRGRPELDLDEEMEERKDEGATVDGGLARLDAPAPPPNEDAD